MPNKKLIHRIDKFEKGLKEDLYDIHDVTILLADIRKHLNNEEFIQRLSDLSDEEVEMLRFMLNQMRAQDPVLDARCKYVALLLERHNAN